MFYSLSHINLPHTNNALLSCHLMTLRSSTFVVCIRKFRRSKLAALSAALALLAIWPFGKFGGRCASSQANPKKKTTNTKQIQIQNKHKTNTKQTQNEYKYKKKNKNASSLRTLSGGQKSRVVLATIAVSVLIVRFVVCCACSVSQISLPNLQCCCLMSLRITLISIRSKLWRWRLQSSRAVCS